MSQLPKDHVGTPILDPREPGIEGPTGPGGPPGPEGPTGPGGPTVMLLYFGADGDIWTDTGQVLGAWETFGFTSANEAANGVIIVPMAGTIRKLTLQLSGSTITVGDWVGVVRKNLIDTAMTASIPNGTAGPATDSVNQFAVAAGDQLSIRNDSVSTTPTGYCIQGILEFVPTL